jgi:hypothetical protein
MHHLCAFLTASFFINFAMAHEGHGLESAHSHASDVWGFVMLGLVVGLAVWFSRKK